MAERRIVTLLGYPLGHSLSPQLHNRAFALQGIDFEYVKTEVAPQVLAEAVSKLRNEPYAGANVTVPHKRAVIAHLDRLTDVAAAVGAVNTIVRNGESSTLVGHNTDVYGFLQPLARHADDLTNTSVLILGAGGAARAAAYALSGLSPERIMVVGRRQKQLKEIVQSMPAVIPLGWPEVPSVISTCGLIVNTTPVGMYPNVAETPLPECTFDAGQIVYDVVYNPVTTRLMEDARRGGATVIGGLEMFLAQAASAYIQWTGREMPVDELRSYLRELLRETSSS